MEGNAKFSHEVSTKEDVIPSYPKAQASQKSVGKFRTSAIDHTWEVSKKTKKQNKKQNKKKNWTPGNIEFFSSSGEQFYVLPKQWECF